MRDKSGIDHPRSMRAPLRFLVGGAVFAILGFLFGRRKRGPKAEDLGPISQQWINEHTAHSQDS